METVALIGRLLVSLAAVLGVMWFIARRARKGVLKKKSSRMIEVLDRANLSRSASVAVVRVNDRTFVLGVAESQVSILGETDPDGMAGVAGTDRVAGTELATPVPSVSSAPSHRPPSHRRVVTRDASGHENRDHSPRTRPLGAENGRQTAAQTAAQNGAFAGSALSPQTWKQTIESLRDLTARP